MESGSPNPWAMLRREMMGSVDVDGTVEFVCDREPSGNNSV